MENIEKFNYLQGSIPFRGKIDTLTKLETFSINEGITVEQEKPKIILQDNTLYQLLSENRLLTSISRPILNKTFNYFADKTILLFLTDTNGFIIDLVSSPEIILSCFNIGIMLGSCMNYSSFGTNSISMAMHDNSPITLLAEEHYCNNLKIFNCFAIPLRIDNQLVGFLNLSSRETKDLLDLTSQVFLLADLIEIHFKYSLEKNNHINNLPYEKDTTIDDKHHPLEDKIYFYGKIMTHSKLNVTIREIEILYLLHIKKKSDQIITQLAISKNTFKTHLKNIYQKLGVCSINDCLSQINILLYN